MATQAEEAVQLQDTAAERFFPVWQMALSSARASAPSPPSEPPGSLNAATTLAFTAILVAVYASLRRRSSRMTPPSRDIEPPEPPSTGEIRKLAEEQSGDVSRAIWKASVEHVANNPTASDTPFARRASWSTGASASSSAQENFASDLGFGYKVWISRGDEKVRPLHRRLHGKVEEVGTPFRKWPSGQVLAFPGDRRAPPEAWINCRCFLWAATDVAETEHALQPANLDSAFALAASAWLYDLDHDGTGTETDGR